MRGHTPPIENLVIQRKRKPPQATKHKSQPLVMISETVRECGANYTLLKFNLIYLNLFYLNLNFFVYF